MRTIFFVVVVFVLYGNVVGDLPSVAYPPLRICAFNIRVFGQTKMEKEDVVSNIITILVGYDLILIQEIRDSSDTAFNGLKEELNKKITLMDGLLGDVFDSVISAKLGRSSSKEEYGFLYRRNLLSVIDTYQFPVELDLFERPPFVVRFESPTTDIEDFAVLALHTKPSMAPEEIGNVTIVYDAVSSAWDLKDILVAGDLNADCDYLQDRDHDNVALFTDTRFKWLIGDDVDTTTGNSECSYDRFVAAGANLQNSAVPNSAKVVKFDELLGLTDEETMLVSDHYPIEMKLAGKANVYVQSKVKDSKSVQTTSTVPVESVYKIRELYKNDIYDLSGSRTYKVTILKEGYSQALITAELDQLTSSWATVLEIQHFRSQFPLLLTPEMEAVIYALMDSESFTMDYIYGIPTRVPHYSLELSCVVDTLLCTIRVVKQFG